MALPGFCAIYQMLFIYLFILICFKKRAILSSNDSILVVSIIVLCMCCIVKLSFQVVIGLFFENRICILRMLHPLTKFT